MGNESKLMTFVKIENGQFALNGHKYEFTGAVDHIGNNLTHGHYVTFLKFDSGKWMKFDDEHFQECTIQQANTRNNYILLFKKITSTAEFDISTIESNTKDQTKPDKIQSEIDQRIAELEYRQTKTLQEKSELRRLKNNRCKRNARMNETQGQTDTRRLKNRQNMNLTRKNETQERTNENDKVEEESGKSWRNC